MVSHTRGSWWRVVPVAVLLMGLLPRFARSEDSLRYKFQSWQEDAGRIRVDSHYALIEKDLPRETKPRLIGSIDVITEARPVRAVQGFLSCVGCDPARAGTARVAGDRRKRRRKAIGISILPEKTRPLVPDAVQPWERAALASYSMRAERDPLATAMTEHINFSREASTGGRGVGGSGCN